MKRKTLILTTIAAMLTSANGVAQSNSSDVITLNLAKATTELTFESDNGAWTGTYDDDETEIESQVFSFVHNSMGAYKTWWGFTASNSCNNKYQPNTLTYQFSNMALGGIVLDADGAVKLDENGSPLTSADVPYLVGYAAPGFSRHPADMTFIGDDSYEVIGAYFNLNSYAFYTLILGDGVARAFTNDDEFILTVHGVAPDGSENTVDVTLASCTNGMLTQSRGWTYVDLSSLGTVNQIWFSMTSTDTGTWGMNTPAYFCMDKLMVKKAAGHIDTVKEDESAIVYDRASKTISLSDGDFAIVFDAAGRKVLTAETRQFSIASLPAGVYIVKSGNHQSKIAR